MQVIRLSVVIFINIKGAKKGQINVYHFNFKKITDLKNRIFSNFFNAF